MNHYIPFLTPDGTVIVRSSEDASLSVCCVFSSDGNLEVARFDNSKIPSSLCAIWNDKEFQQGRPFFGNTLCIFLGIKDMQNKDLYDFITISVATEVEEIHSKLLDIFGKTLLIQPELFHPSLVSEIARMN